MSEAFKYVAGLSPWVAIPIILLTLFVTLWPKIYQVFIDLNADHRAFKNELRRLELLKLRYEIEAIRKSNDLDKISIEPPSGGSAPSEPLLPEPLPPGPLPPGPLPPEALPPEPSPTLTLPLWKRFSFGAMGALIPSLYKISVAVALEGVAPPLMFYVGVALLCLFGGMGASAVPKDRASRFLCVMVGLSMVLVIQMGFAEVAQRSAPPPNLVPAPEQIG